jgi:GNAT superfamily N-acetyltransferase
MTDHTPVPPVVDLPAGLAARIPGPADIEPIVALVSAHEQAVKGSSGVDPSGLAASVTGVGSWTRRQVVVEDSEGTLLAWASVHDRAAGRTVVHLTVHPDAADAADADAMAAALLAWAETTARAVAAARDLTATQLDASALAGDVRQRRWLAEAGYRHTRTWLHLSRPVAAEEAEPGALPASRPGVHVRRVAEHEDGLPLASDLQTVHQMLEESFTDHFNSYRESFPEFLQRLREDPGHRWDHWWIASLDEEGVEVPAGALVSSVLPPDATGVRGSYIDYIGVHRRARGRGVAKALLHTVIADTARRGRNRLDLEVDADSPTGADQLYASMGWRPNYTTESWHRDIAVEEAGS